MAKRKKDEKNLFVFDFIESKVEPYHASHIYAWTSAYAPVICIIAGLKCRDLLKNSLKF